MLGATGVHAIQVLLATNERFVYHASRIQIDGGTLLLTEKYAGEMELVAVFAPGCWIHVSEVTADAEQGPVEVHRDYDMETQLRASFARRLPGGTYDRLSREQSEAAATEARRRKAGE